MKLVCDCGNEMEFILLSTTDDSGSTYAKESNHNFSICCEDNDQIWITCNKCEKSITVLI